MPLDNSTIAVLNDLLAVRRTLLPAHYAEVVPLDFIFLVVHIAHSPFA
jgi:thiosulfate reductase cytochrome b subunit